MDQKINKRRKRFQKDRTVNFKLTERDGEILKWVYRHRFLSSEQIVRLVEGGRQGILRRLALMYHGGYLDRPSRQKFVFGNNHCLIYGLGNRGADWIASENDLPVETVDWTRKNREAKEIFLAHTIMVSEILTALRLACRKRRDIEFVEPDQLIKRRQKSPSLKTHALSWRVNITKGQYAQKRSFSFNMIPDSVFGLRITRHNKIQEAYFFLEADRSTMPIKRTNFFRSSFYKKMVGYIASYRNELFSEYFGFKKVRVLTVTKSDERIKNMIQTNRDLHESGSGYGLFLFTTDGQIDIHKPEKILKRIWTNGKGENISLSG